LDKPGPQATRQFNALPLRYGRHTIGNHLDHFHPIVGDWFRRTFAAPTPAQVSGWPAIATGRHTLISAPTGSGKTLAAFLVCIDGLLRVGLKGGLEDVSKVVYVSPLKALSNDVHKNLAVPLKEMRQLAADEGLALPEIRVALRTGDTPAHERQAYARRPPHIWITTPESLYILLTSASGRRALAGVRTLILDEIHAVAGNKRGSHLALTAERLCALASGPVMRIGLSATQRPIEEVARFLVGSRNIDPAGAPDCAVVDMGYRRDMDLQIEMPSDELGSVATQELWNETVERISSLAMEHSTTLVFVNTRRIVERVAHLLSQKMGEQSVVAHHGSLSRKTRLAAEERLKHAEVKVCVATASLELGIDVGAIELACQIGSPRSISVLLQRVGRSGHWLGGVPKGRLFPLTRDELIECAALLRAVRRDELECVTIPSWPLDILSQQIIAMCSAEDWQVEELYRTVRAAYPYRDLPRSRFDDVIRMLSDGVSTRLGRMRSAHLHHDRVNGVLRGRRGARIAAVTSGGAIPDNADFRVVQDPEGTYVGSVTEDFAVESVAGDVFLLGNTAWRIRRIEKGTVRVEDARGQSPNIPFWLGEAPSRTRELSREVSAIREGIDARLSAREACLDWLRDDVGLPPAAAHQAAAYVSEGRRVLGSVPTAERIVAERFFDESGGTQLVIHSVLGGRINRAWGLALRKRFCRSFDFELQASATDDGINLSLGPQHSFPLEDIFRFLGSRTVEEPLVQAVLASPLFATRWRWTLTRSLALLRFSSGRRVAAHLQRMRADDLLAAIFPAQAGCQDNRQGPDLSIPDHPLVFETLRDCLHEALDLDGLRRVLSSLEKGTVQFLAKDTPLPSVFSHQILNAMPYAFLDDAPLEERRARAVLLRRVLPETSGDLGRLDPEAIRAAAEDAWPAVRDPEELHDLLIGVGLFPETEMRRLPAESGRWLESLAQSGRALRVAPSGIAYWLAAERRDLSQKVRLPTAPDGEGAPDSESVTSVIRGWIEISGPLTERNLAEMLRFPVDGIRSALAQLEGEGLVLRGSFTGQSQEEFCDRRILARIHRATIAQLRREIEPVSAAVLLRFLFSWQHVVPEAALEREPGALEVIEQLQGFETAAAAWEEALLPSRVRDYDPAMLDDLCLAGEVVWGRWTRRTTHAEVPARRPGLSRNAILGLGIREDLPWLLDVTPPDERELSVPSRNVLSVLRRRGALFFPELLVAAKHLPSEAEEALWQLVAAGLVTADSYAALRALVSGEARRQEASRRRRHKPRRTREGRWSLLETEPSPDANEMRARQYLRRYGVLCRELLAREGTAPPWRDLLPILRRSEGRGEIRGGRFVAGLIGEQFALPEAVEALRSERRIPPAGRFVRVSACDPLNLVGIVTPGSRIPAVLGNRVIYRDGVPVAASEAGCTRLLGDVDPGERREMDRLLDERPV
jgi:ATP-dependent helicase Lhr and Lhr-like helicase